jgi:hypothetical protein
MSPGSSTCRSWSQALVAPITRATAAKRRALAKGDPVVDLPSPVVIISISAPVLSVLLEGVERQKETLTVAMKLV